jgi:hypothetical protein
MGAGAFRPTSRAREAVGSAQVVDMPTFVAFAH